LRKSLKMLFTIPANRRAAIAACGLMFFQQFCGTYEIEAPRYHVRDTALTSSAGFNTLMYYSSTLFDIVGFSNPIAVGSVVAVVNWIFTVLSIFIIDRVGRRRLLLWTMWGMPLCLLLAAIAFIWVPIDHKTLELTSDEVGWPAYLVLVAMILFVAFYAAGLGCVPWQANEFLPMEVRAMGTMMINVFNWGPNIVVSATFLTMMKHMTPSGTFGFYAGLCVMGWIFVYCCFPEASQMTLEEVRQVFEHGFGVKYAEEWRKEYKRGEKARGPIDHAVKA
jgi:SP family myo-inositol transporter-like MFS transporter 13